MSTVDMVVQRCNGPRRLRDHDDDDYDNTEACRTDLFHFLNQCLDKRRSRTRRNPDMICGIQNLLTTQQIPQPPQLTISKTNINKCKTRKSKNSYVTCKKGRQKNTFSNKHVTQRWTESPKLTMSQLRDGLLTASKVNTKETHYKRVLHARRTCINPETQLEFRHNSTMAELIEHTHLHQFNSHFLGRSR